MQEIFRNLYYTDEENALVDVLRKILLRSMIRISKLLQWLHGFVLVRKNVRAEFLLIREIAIMMEGRT